MIANGNGIAAGIDDVAERLATVAQIIAGMQLTVAQMRRDMTQSVMTQSVAAETRDDARFEQDAIRATIRELRDRGEL